MTHNFKCNRGWQWVLVISLLCLLTMPARAVIPDNIDYQGYLTDDAGSPVNGTVNVTFALYNVDTGGIALWSDTQSVSVVNGLFTSKLGGTTAPFPVGLFDNPLWLGINVESDGEMSPRIAMSSAGFAHKADDALTLEGQSAASLDQSAHVTDTGNPHNVTAAQVGAMSSAEFTLHIGDPSAHHSRYTDAEAVAAMGLIDNSNPLNHQRRSGDQVFNAVLSRDGAGTGLDADFLDGLDSTAFMPSGTDNWVNITGDTMTGNLSVLANIGIGTTPAYKLDVRGGSGSYLGYFYNDNNTAGSNTNGIYVNANSYDTGTGTSSGSSFNSVGGNAGGNAYATTHWAWAYGSGNAYGVYSDADGGSTTGREYAFYGLGDAYVSGKVGIGTTNPVNKLDVVGNSYFSGKVGIGATSPASKLAVAGGATIGSAYISSVQSDGNLALTGNMGINVTTPSYRLQVMDSVNNYIGFFHNSNNTGSANGIYARGDAYNSDTGTGKGGFFYGIGGHTNGAAYGISASSEAFGTATSYGVYSSANNGFTTGNEYAFFGWGDAFISGNLSKGSGSFKIDHPLDPENKYLYHSFVESPDMMNIYNGNVVLDENGSARVTLPDWFDALNKDFRYQLTCIGGFAPVYIAQKITNNTFAIAGGNPGMEVSWMVTGIRKDAYANTHRIPVEENKPANETGTYLHPEAFGLTRDRSLANAQAIEMGHELK